MELDFKNEIEINQRRQCVKYENNSEYLTMRTTISRTTEQLFFSIQTNSTHSSFDDLQCSPDKRSKHSNEDKHLNIHRSEIVGEYSSPRSENSNVMHDTDVIIDDTSCDSHRSNSFISDEDRFSDTYDENSLTDVQHLHELTSIMTKSFCFDFMKLLRDANVCKSHSNRLIELIQSILPIPNNFPFTMKELLSLIDFSDLFVKKIRLFTM